MKSRNDLMQDNSYLKKLENLLGDKKFIIYSNFLFSYVKKYVVNNNREINVIADVGCGTGFNTSLLRKFFKNSKILSVDYTKHNLEYGEKELFIVNPVLSSIYDLKTNLTANGNEFVDMIFLGDVIEHLDNIPLALENIFNSLNPGGYFVLHTPNKLYSLFFKTPPDPTHIHEFSPKELKTVLNEHGFLIKKLAPSGIPLINKISPSFSQKISYTKLGEFLFKLIPILGPSIFVIAYKVK